MQTRPRKNVWKSACSLSHVRSQQCTRRWINLMKTPEQLRLTKEATQKKKLVLQEDRFLDEELDNARNSAMVETKRDRLIRLVSDCLLQHCAPYYANTLRCSRN